LKKTTEQVKGKRQKENNKGRLMKSIHGICIYENLKEIVDPAHSCLVVWDVQNGLMERSFKKAIPAFWVQ
jgi:hypothetical protein